MNDQRQYEMFDERAHFDGKASEAAKESGMYAAAMSHKAILQAARELAVQLGLRYGNVTIDDVQAVLIQWGHEPGELGMAAGSVFRGKVNGGYIWMKVGDKKTTRVTSHARPVVIWQLTPEAADYYEAEYRAKGMTFDRNN